MRTTTRRGNVLHVRLSANEHAMVAQLASGAGISHADCIRRLIQHNAKAKLVEAIDDGRLEHVEARVEALHATVRGIERAILGGIAEQTATVRDMLEALRALTALTAPVYFGINAIIQNQKQEIRQQVEQQVAEWRQRTVVTPQA